MRRNLSFLVCFVGVLAFTAIPFSVSCIGDEPGVEVLEQQEPITVPMVVQVDEWCDDCLRKPVKKILSSKPARRVVVERPRLQRKPVRSLLRRLFSR